VLAEFVLSFCKADVRSLQEFFADFNDVILSPTVETELKPIRLLQQLITADDGFLAVHFHDVYLLFKEIKPGATSAKILDAVLSTRGAISRKRRAEILAAFYEKYPDLVEETLVENLMEKVKDTSTRMSSLPGNLQAFKKFTSSVSTKIGAGSSGATSAISSKFNFGSKFFKKSLFPNAPASSSEKKEP